MNISPAAPWIDDDAGDSYRQMIDQEERLKNLPVDFQDDALAASWASYHVWQKSPARRWTSLTDVMIGPHDREIAEVTRRYYRDKIAMQSLRQGEVSQFRQDLYDICNGGVLRHKHMGMLYRLPYFYVEDIGREALKQDVKHHPSSDGVQSQTGHTIGKVTWRLWSDRRIFRSRRRAEIMEYWFRDDRGHAVMWPVNYGDDMRILVDSIFDRASRYNHIHAYYRIAQDPRTDFRFWRILQAELTFNE